MAVKAFNGIVRGAHGLVTKTWLKRAALFKKLDAFLLRTPPVICRGGVIFIGSSIVTRKTKKLD